MSSLTSGIDILQCFASERPELRVSDVARRLNMPKSTVTRLLKEMLHHGLVEQDRKTRLASRVPALSDVPYPVVMEPNLVVEFYSR